MNHEDHVRLLEGAVPRAGGRWGDFGSGDGAFTLALADLLGPTGTIHSVDRDGRALARQQRRMAGRFPGVDVHYHHGDYTESLNLPPLDGLVMANALHFHRDKGPLVARLGAMLRASGRFVLVEYNTDRGNRWVPHPLSFETWSALAPRHGLTTPRCLATAPSSFLGEFFAALSFRRDESNGQIENDIFEDRPVA